MSRATYFSIGIMLILSGVYAISFILLIGEWMSLTKLFGIEVRKMDFKHASLCGWLLRAWQDEKKLHENGFNDLQIIKDMQREFLKAGYTMKPNKASGTYFTAHDANYVLERIMKGISTYEERKLLASYAGRGLYEWKLLKLMREAKEEALELID